MGIGISPVIGSAFRRVTFTGRGGFYWRAYSTRGRHLARWVAGQV
jgi:hypothetical protein